MRLGAEVQRVEELDELDACVIRDVLRDQPRRGGVVVGDDCCDSACHQGFTTVPTLTDSFAPVAGRSVNHRLETPVAEVS